MHKNDNSGIPVFQTIKPSVTHKPSLVLFNLQYLEMIRVSVDDFVLSLNILKFPIAEVGIVGKLMGLSLISIHVCGRDNFS